MGVPKYPAAVAEALRPDATSLVRALQAIVDKGGDPEVRDEMLAHLIVNANQFAEALEIEGVVPLTIGRKLDLIAAQSEWQVVFDGCHKIYVCRNLSDIAEMEDCGWEAGDLHPAGRIHEFWAQSCFLRFVNFADLKPHPWAIEQGDEDGDEGESDGDGE
jgi:hypothetical protein